MQNRKSNDINKNNANKGNHFWRYTIGQTASFTGLFNGFIAGCDPYYRPIFPYAFSTAFAIGVGIYGIKRLSSICIGNKEDLNRKSEAKDQAAIAAIAFGASTQFGSSAAAQESKFWYSFDDCLLRAGFTKSSLPRLSGMTVVVAGLVIGFASPILIVKIKNRLQKLEGTNLKEQEKFFLFNDRSKHIKGAPTKNEEKKDTNGCVLRKS